MYYKAILFATDGDWVTDHIYPTIDEVWEAVSNQGSKWFFYPISAVIKHNGALTTSRQRIISCPEILEGNEGLSIKTFSKLIRDFPYWETVLA